MKLPLLVAGLGLLLCGGSACATELAVGDTAPDFALPGSDGKTHRLADCKGHTVVLAWFPKAFTGG
jgi:peroxiredoxin Q/BCP